MRAILHAYCPSSYRRRKPDKPYGRSIESTGKTLADEITRVTRTVASPPKDVWPAGAGGSDELTPDDSPFCHCVPPRNCG